MSILKISELPVKTFTNDSIDHCFYVENMNTPEMRLVPLVKIFDWIKDQANKDGLTVEMEGDRIMFIRNEKIEPFESVCYPENGTKLLREDLKNIKRPDWFDEEQP
jgi:hypothetical protein